MALWSNKRGRSQYLTFISCTDCYQIICALIVVLFSGCERNPSSRQEDRKAFDSTACTSRGAIGVLIQCTTYYRENKVRRIYSHRNDTLVGEDREFDENGTLRTYSYYNVVGRLMYSRSYNALRNMSEEYGDVVVQQIIDPPEAQVGDTITVRVYIINPPGITKALVGIDKHLDKYPLFQEEEESGVFVERFAMPRPGSFRVAYEASVKDSVDGTPKVENNSFVIRFLPPRSR